MVRDRFDRDQHEILIRQLYHIRQTSTVAEYVTNFTKLVDQLKSYAVAVDQVYFTTRFVDGLRLDIRAIVIVHRPKTLDTACTLALLQEEAGGSKDGPKSVPSSSWKSALKTALPLPLPPKTDKPVPVPVPVPAAGKPP